MDWRLEREEITRENPLALALNSKLKSRLKIYP